MSLHIDIGFAPGPLPYEVFVEKDGHRYVLDLATLDTSHMASLTPEERDGVVKELQPIILAKGVAERPAEPPPSVEKLTRQINKEAFRRIKQKYTAGLVMEIVRVQQLEAAGVPLGVPDQAVKGIAMPYFDRAAELTRLVVAMSDGERSAFFPERETWPE